MSEEQNRKTQKNRGRNRNRNRNRGGQNRNPEKKSGGLRPPDRKGRDDRRASFLWEKYVGGLRIFGDERLELSAIKCSVLPSRQERERIGTKEEPLPFVYFRACDLLTVLREGSYKGTIEDGLMEGRIERGEIKLLLAPTSLQKMERPSQMDINEKCVTWHFPLDLVQYVEGFIDLLRETVRRADELEKRAKGAASMPSNAEMSEAIGLTSPKKKAQPQPRRDDRKPERKPERPHGNEPGGMGTFADKFSEELGAAKEMTRKQKARLDGKDKKKAEAPKPTPDAKSSPTPAEPASESEPEAPVRTITTVQVEPSGDPPITEKQARMFLSQLKENGGDLDALPVTNPASLDVIRKVAKEAKITLKETEHLVQ